LTGSLLGLTYDSGCCDGTAHDNSTFYLEDWLPPPPPPSQTPGKCKRNGADNDKRTRQPKHKKPLQERLLRWRREVSEKDEYCSLYPEYLILSDSYIPKIIAPHPLDMRTLKDLAGAMEITSDGE
jgi:hypothetical protein